MNVKRILMNVLLLAATTASMVAQNETNISHSEGKGVGLWALICGAAALCVIAFLCGKIIQRNRMAVKIKILEDRLHRRYDDLVRNRDEIAALNEQICEQRQEINDGLLYASRIQKALMLSDAQIKAILPEHFIFFRPRKDVSGDFYWAERQGNKILFATADSTGHGVPGAFMSLLGISLLSEISNKHEAVNAATLLDELHSTISSSLSTGIGEHPDGIDIAICIFNTETMELQYAGAYHPLYIVRKGQLIEYTPDKRSVGMPDTTNSTFTNFNIVLENDDMIYLFSDGYIDQFGGDKNIKFKVQPFKELLTKVAVYPIEKQKTLITDVHDSWKGEQPQIDDILVMGVRVSGKA